MRALVAQAIIDEINRLDLLTNTRETGDYLYSKLSDLSARFPNRMSNLRGKGEGTFIAWDESTLSARDEFLGSMKKLGVNIGGTGERGIRLRPMLIFGKGHADILVDALEKCYSS